MLDILIRNLRKPSFECDLTIFLRLFDALFCSVLLGKLSTSQLLSWYNHDNEKLFSIVSNVKLDSSIFNISFILSVEMDFSDE